MTQRLLVVTGPRGSGKSYLASTYLPPSRMGEVFYHDSEHSANQALEQLAAAGLRFGYYKDLSARWADLPADKDLLNRINTGKLPWVSEQQKRSLLAYYQDVLDDLDRHLERGKFQVYVHDTLEKLEAGMAAWVEENKKAAGVTRTAYGGLWLDGVFPLYEGLLNAVWARGVETIIFCSHLKTPWEGDKPVLGAVEPSGKKILYRLTSLYLWLVHDGRNADGAPAGIVLKERLGTMGIDLGKDEWNPRRLLPVRIPHCTWRDINRYLQAGCNLSQPAPGESLSADEAEMISELLSDKQLELMMLQTRLELQQQTSPVVEVGSVPLPVDGVRAREMAATGISAEDIAGLIGKPLPLVKHWLAGS